ncbi:MAG: DUF1631 family protein, partial [Sedimenticola sp.]
MAATDNIIAFGSLRDADSAVSFKEEYRDSVGACRQVILKLLTQRMERLFQQLDDTFYAQADKADTNHRQTLYFDAMRELRRQRDSIENHFNQRLLKSYDVFWRQGPGGGCTVDTDTLLEDEISLVANHDLEEGLAVSGMISRGESSYFRELYALDRRFSHLLNDLPISGEDNPLSPATICNTFKGAIDNLSVDLQMKLVVYKQFELVVVGELAELYGELNSTLARAGVLPKLKHSVRRSNTGSAAPVTTTVEGAAAVAETDSAANAGELFGTLRQLLEQHRVVTGDRRSQPSSKSKIVETGDVLTALSALQQDGSSTDGVKGGLFQVLGIEGEGRSGKAINQMDGDALDVISMLFEFILDDPGLADGMRALLARLQIPMLKVAILDKSFFSRKEHPARILLNTLAQSAVGWSEAVGREEGGLYRQVESVVSRILSEFSDNLALFDELNQQFEAFAVRRQSSARVAETRASQVTQGKEQLLQARKEVQEQIVD